MKASEWIDRLKAEREWGSDYRVAKELELAASTLTRYRSKPESTMDDDVAIKVAEALKEPPALVLIDQAAERTKSVRARAEMIGVLEIVRGKLRAAARVGGGKGRIDITSIAATLTLAGAALFGAPQPAQAGQSETIDTGIRIVSNKRRRNRRTRSAAAAPRAFRSPRHQSYAPTLAAA